MSKSTIVSKSEMKHALSRTKAGETNKSRSNKKKAKRALLDEMFHNINNEVDNTFINYKEIKEKWDSSFSLSADKLADIAMNIYNKSEGKDLDKALDIAFTLDEKLAKIANKKINMLKNLTEEIVSKMFFKAKNTLSYEEALDVFLGDDVKSKSVIGEVIRSQDEIFKHLYVAYLLVEFAKTKDENKTKDIEEFREKYTVELSIFSFADRKLESIKKNGLTPCLFYSLLEVYLRYFETFCRDENAFFDMIREEFFVLF